MGAAGAVVRPNRWRHIAAMDFDLSDEQRAFEETARHFAARRMAARMRRAGTSARNFPVGGVAPGGRARLCRHLCRRGVRRQRARAARCGDHLRGTGGRLRLDRRLSLDPQHGGVDDRPLRQRGAARAASCRSSMTMEHFASYCLTEPGSGSDAAALADARACATATITC